MTTTSTDRPRPSGRRQDTPAAQPRKPKFTPLSDEDIDKANEELARAFQIAGLTGDGGLKCPACGAAKKKVQLKTSTTSGKPYWKCQKCQAHGSATKLLQDYRGYSFRDAVNELLGRPVNGEVREVKDIPQVVIEPEFRATVDTEVYDAIRRAGSLAKAQEYYKLIAHIDPQFVQESGSTYLVGAKGIQAKLVEVFGIERLKAAGVVKVDRNGNDMFLFSDNYPVIEAHERACSDLRRSYIEYLAAAKEAEAKGEEIPLKPFIAPPCKRDTSDGHGHVVGMQFRPSLAQKAKFDAHIAWKKRWGGLIDDEGQEIEASEAWKAAHELAPAAAGVKHEYVPKFMSLAGAGVSRQSLVGTGLRRLATIEAGKPVYVVEGSKDQMAARTMGAEAYSLPGTGATPPDAILPVLARHKMVVCMDGDEAGKKGRDAMVKFFSEANIPAQPKLDVRDGMDIADILVERHAHDGCACATCTAWRQEHPYDPERCVCTSCAKRRLG